MSIARNFLILLVVLIVTGCTARTEVSSFTDPEFRGQPRLGSVAVYANGLPLDERQAVENKLAEGLSKRGVRVIRGIDLTPPTRQLSDEEWASAVIASGVQSVLFVTAVDKGVSSTYVPKTYHPGTTTATVNQFGNTAIVNVQQSPGYTTGGYTVKKPNAQYSGSLIHVSSGRQIWQSSASSRGNAFANFRDLGESMASTTIEKLIKDGLF